MIDDGIDGVLLDRKRRRWGWGSFATCHVCTALKFICSGKSLCPFYMKPVTSIFPFIIAAPKKSTVASLPGLAHDLQQQLQNLESVVNRST